MYPSLTFWFSEINTPLLREERGIYSYATKRSSERLASYNSEGISLAASSMSFSFEVSSSCFLWISPITPVELE